jgi:carboxylesterase type B
VSERIQTYWTNFAKAGDPNGAPALAWGRLSASDNVRLNFGLQSSVVNGFRASECALWRAGYERAFATP